MTTAQIEARLAALEAEVARLKAQQAPRKADKPAPASGMPWWDKVAGMYAAPDKRKDFQQAMRLARRWRRSAGRAASAPEPRKSTKKRSR